MNDVIPPTIEWRGDSVRLIDQRLLPGAVAYGCPGGEAGVRATCQALR